MAGGGCKGGLKRLELIMCAGRWIEIIQLCVFCVNDPAPTEIYTE